MQATTYQSLLKAYHLVKQRQFDPNDLCFKKQLDFVSDPSQFAMAVTSRRAGKTTACGIHLLATALRIADSVSLYIATARTNAKKIIWPMLHFYNNQYALGGVPNESDLSFKFPNGAVIYVSGAATSNEINRFRGLALRLVYIDESQDFGSYLKPLIDDVLVPACFDHKGQIRLIGTPGPVPVGFYHDAWIAINGWAKHAWTMFDNPWILKKRGETPSEILKQELERRGVTESDPTIQRELFGRFVVDTRRLVVDYNAERNHFGELPVMHLKYLIGIDIGFEDADAIAVLAYSEFSPVTYLVHESINQKQGLTELIGQIESLRQRYAPIKMVIDEGGLGKKLAEEIRRRYAIPIHGADKKRKIETIEIMNDALRTSKLLAKKTSRFANDAMLLEWDFDKSTPDKRIVSDRFHSDIVDAVIYAFKESPAFSWREQIKSPKPGTKEWGIHEAKEMENAAIEYFKKGEIEVFSTEMEWL